MAKETMLAPFEATTECLGEKVANIILEFFFQTMDKAIEDEESAKELFQRYTSLGDILDVFDKWALNCPEEMQKLAKEDLRSLIDKACDEASLFLFSKYAL